MKILLMQVKGHKQMGKIEMGIGRRQIEVFL